MKLDIAVLSRRGGHARNEDACGYWTSDDYCCWVVSDGAGGHGGGDVASRTVVSNIVREFASGPSVTGEAIETLVRGANRAVLVKQKLQREFQEMRATVAVLLLDRTRECLLWGTIGDTRVYGFRNGVVQFQTRDHSVMQSMLSDGDYAAAALRQHPARSVLMHALGADQRLPCPVTHPPLFLRDGDAMLLCTDGLWAPVDESAMEQCLSTAANAEHWLALLEGEILRSGSSRLDNYSAIAIKVSDLRDSTFPGFG